MDDTAHPSHPYRGPLWLPLALPFAAYMGFIALEGGLDQLAAVAPAAAPLAEADHLWLYPVKIAVVLGLLWHYRHAYRPFVRPAAARHWGLSVGVGIAVFGLWIQMDWPWAQMGDGGEGYNPLAAGSGATTLALVAVRLAGASIVVPVMEELFWRGFIMRYLIHPEFTRIPPGRFTWASFLITAVLFGLEHHLWLAGIMAGLFYGGLLCITRNLPTVIVAHGVTNLLLGIWVLATGNWLFW